MLRNDLLCFSNDFLMTVLLVPAKLVLKCLQYTASEFEINQVQQVMVLSTGLPCKIHLDLHVYFPWCMGIFWKLHGY